jgi:hypothetical protein
MPQQEELVLEAYGTWAKLFELYRYYSWVVDRFHISTQAWQLIYAKRHYDFGAQSYFVSHLRSER